MGSHSGAPTKIAIIGRSRGPLRECRTVLLTTRHYDLESRSNNLQYIGRRNGNAAHEVLMCSVMLQGGTVVLSGNITTRGSGSLDLSFDRPDV